MPAYLQANGIHVPKCICIAKILLATSGIYHKMMLSFYTKLQKNPPPSTEEHTKNVRKIQIMCSNCISHVL